MVTTPSPGGRVTSADVAREAGLSRATVSYVLNRDPRQTIPEGTRQRVLDAAERLGYRPYGPARLLRGARSSVVLLFTPGLERATDAVAADIIRRLGHALSDRGLHLVWQLGETEDSAPAVDLSPVVVLSSAADGDPVLDHLRGLFPVPVLSVFPGLSGFIGGSATAQVHHLASRGRRNLLYVAPAQTDQLPMSDVRRRAVIDAAARLGLPRPYEVTIPTDRPGITRSLRTMLDTHPAIDGVCAYNDEVAFAVLAAAHDADLDVPDRLAVIGIDDHPLGPMAVPSLSTVTSDVEDFVSDFADHVAGLAAGEELPAPVMPVEARVIARASS